ncbi:MAG: TlyA family RNA methyltransferase [Acidimicrobiaceae bacterium]|nr:TlyA family RNA methyltransferase [Acidimicrobiaceae bacterium]
MDAEMVRRGLASSRAAAQQLIDLGRVRVSGSVAERAARQVSPAEPVLVTGEPDRFVGRGGMKLDAALDRFGIDVSGRVALDAGASTGGFTDCLLQRGAAHVTAVDVGRGQLHEKLRADSRVTSLEQTNIRNLRPAELAGAPFDVVVADLSFISLRTVAPALVGLAAPDADLVVLVKPQFEAGRAEADRGRGVIRDPAVWTKALLGAIGALEGEGAAMMGVMVSPLRGADGNVEFLAHLVVRPGPDPEREGAPAALAERLDLPALLATLDAPAASRRED